MGDLEARSFDGIVEALRAAVPVLHAAEIPFLLGGSMAVWAYGGPEPVNDLDLMVRPQDAERAQQALAAAGFRTEDPPEEWLLKAWHDDVLVDLIFGPRGVPIDDATIARGHERSLAAIRLRVMALEDVITSKLLALDEHQLDMSYLLQLVRAVREQLDWDEIRRRTGDWPYAAAFLTLVDRLGISDAGDAPPIRHEPPLERPPGGSPSPGVPPPGPVPATEPPLDRPADPSARREPANG